MTRFTTRALLMLAATAVLLAFVASPGLAQNSSTTTSTATSTTSTTITKSADSSVCRVPNCAVCLVDNVNQCYTCTSPYVLNSAMTACELATTQPNGAMGSASTRTVALVGVALVSAIMTAL
ncbi:uncharacterized protein LOC126767101 [Bactrocera neohumeralis]|uniref:uncharacterized protein LOC126767101 n=1 Tax=Bactrocera neohumeralis TaxID=98809 RepID=UPI002165851B|nr:uncharacterized protein LOC126767101 [Bactrocera neohumeralis]